MTVIETFLTSLLQLTHPAFGRLPAVLHPPDKLLVSNSCVTRLRPTPTSASCRVDDGGGRQLEGNERLRQKEADKEKASVSCDLVSCLDSHQSLWLEIY